MANSGDQKNTTEIQHAAISHSGSGNVFYNGGFVPIPTFPVNGSNLPNRHPHFVGRQDKLQEVINALSSRSWIIGIDGMGGIGKTTLALEVAHLCKERNPKFPGVPRFTGYIWTSARDRPNFCLTDIIRDILYVLSPFETMRRNLSLVEQLSLASRALGAEPRLLIVDNLESIEVKDELLYKFLKDLPDPSKALITSRLRINTGEEVITLSGLTESDSIKLLRLEASRLKVPIGEQDIVGLHIIAQKSFGIPFVLRWMMERIREGLTLEWVIESLESAEAKDVFDYIFEKSLSLLDLPTKAIFRSMSLLPTWAKIETIAAMNPQIAAIPERVGELVKYSLVEDNLKLTMADRRYQLHPFTRYLARKNFDEIDNNADRSITSVENALRYYLNALSSNKVEDKKEREDFEADFTNLYNLIQFAFHFKRTSLLDQCLQIAEVIGKIDGKRVRLLLDFMIEPLHKFGNADLILKLLNLISQHYYISFAIDESRQWKGSAIDKLIAPIGINSSGQIQYLELSQGLSAHGCIVGITGSGKSNLLNLIILQLALYYTKQELALYLVDFKDTVEFQSYSTLPHVRSMILGNEREAGLELLKQLHMEMDKRASLLRDTATLNISEYRRSTGQDLPRALLIMDGYRILFNQDDRIAEEAKLILESLLMRGRSLGVHVLLCSQTIQEGFSGRILSNLGLRIVLRCQPQDASAILGEENIDVKKLTRPGEAIYNDAAGNKEKNVLIRVAFLSDDARQHYLKIIHGLASHKEGPGSAMFHNGNVEFHPLELPDQKVIPSIAQAIDNQWIPNWLFQDIMAGKINYADIEEKLKKLAHDEFFRSLLKDEQVLINQEILDNNPAITRDHLIDTETYDTYNKFLEEEIVTSSPLKEQSDTEEKETFEVSADKHEVAKPITTNTTHIGHVSGAVHTGSGDINIDALSYSNAISTKDEFLAALRAFKSELEVAREQGLPEETYDDTIVEVEAAEREAKKDTSKPDRITNRLEKAKAVLSAGTGVATATASLVEASNKLEPLLEAAIHAISKIF